MTRCLSKLVLALGTARLARTCVRPLPARPVERPDLPDYAPLLHMVNQARRRRRRAALLCAHWRARGRVSEKHPVVA